MLKNKYPKYGLVTLDKKWGENLPDTKNIADSYNDYKNVVLTIEWAYHLNWKQTPEIEHNG